MLTVFIVLIGALAAFHVFNVFWTAAGARRIVRWKKRDPDKPLPSVSVLVAAKDEERNIEACLVSLMTQDYPSDRYKVVIVDDRSTDRTPELIQKYAEKYPNLTTLRIDKDPVGLTGKQNALRHGVQLCDGEFVLNTDADCEAPPHWVRSMISRFSEDAGLVIGITLTHVKEKKAPLVARIQTLDMAALLTMAAGAAGWSLPISCIGNNFAYRKAAFDEVGGYEAMRQALTEDGELVRMIHRETDWKIAAALEPESIMITEPARTWREFYRQRLRWFLGGFEMRSLPVYFMRVMMFYCWYLVFSPIVAFLVPELLIVTTAAIASKLAADFYLVWQAARQFNRRDILMPYIPFAVYYTLYGGLIGLATIFSKKVVWKGQTYQRRK